MNASSEKRSITIRARIICGCFVLIALLLTVRLYFVQIVHGKEYRDDAAGQYVDAAPDTLTRDAIFFTTKDGNLVSAAVMQSGWRIAITPSQISDAATAYAKLNKITPIDGERFFASAAKKSDPYEEVAFKLDDDTAAKVRALKLPGVILVHDQWRTYPADTLAAQAIGFVGYKGTIKTGTYGLERYYNDTLAVSSSNRYVNPFAEIFTNVEAMLSRDPAAHQGDVITSIEPSVESELEKVLTGVMHTYAPRLAGGIVMDPHTGAIYAIATLPSFNPNEYNLIDDPSVFSNQLVEGRFELGSIMKPLTMAAGIDSGAVTPATTYNDTGCIERSTKRVCNYDFKARGVVPMQEVLNQSLNVGATFVAEKIGHPGFTNYIRLFGFGEKSNIDLPNEVTGDIALLGDGNGPDVNYATASFGQGLSVSPIAMIRALSTLANNGALPNPHVVTGIRYDTGITRSIDPGKAVQVLKPESAEEVTNMLVKVFDNALLKGELKQDHYSIAAKTGTAQIAIPGKGYYTDRYLHSFFGYFPAHDPKFIVFLFTIEPHGAEFASATLAHPFGDIAKFLINYYNIPPDR